MLLYPHYYGIPHVVWDEVIHIMILEKIVPILRWRTLQFWLANFLWSAATTPHFYSMLPILLNDHIKLVFMATQVFVVKSTQIP